MSKHTPGPWGVGSTVARKYAMAHGDWFETTVHVGEGVRRGNALATVSMGGPGALSHEQAEVEANARLIAAAPALLDALRAISDACAEDPSIMDPSALLLIHARAAIARATGETQ